MLIAVGAAIATTFTVRSHSKNHLHLVAGLVRAGGPAHVHRLVLGVVLLVSFFVVTLEDIFPQPREGGLFVYGFRS